MRKGASKRPRQESINWMNVKKRNKREEEEKGGRKTGKARKKQDNWSGGSTMEARQRN